jgi:hypothetical protein
MSHSLRNTLCVLVVAHATLGLATVAAAQATQTKQSVPGSAKVATTQLNGEVAYVQGDSSWCA